MVIAAGVHHPTLMGVGNEAGAMGIVPLGEQDVPQFSRVLADSDLDGLFGAAVLKAFRPDAEVVFTHAAALRSGLVDHLIDRSTALVDLPFHPAVLTIYQVMFRCRAQSISSRHFWEPCELRRVTWRGRGTKDGQAAKILR